MLQIIIRDQRLRIKTQVHYECHCHNTALAAQGNRIKTQAHYECRRHDTPAKPRVKWGQSPIWNPGETENNKIKSSVGAALSARAFALRFGSAAPVGGSINISTQLTQGLRPGLCRSIAPKGAHWRLHHQAITFLRLSGGLLVLVSIYAICRIKIIVLPLQSKREGAKS